MFNLLFGGKSDQNIAEINEITDKILKNPPLPELTECYQHLIKYIPNYTEKILNKISNNLVSILMSPADDGSVIQAIINLLLKMTELFDDSIPGSNPVQILCSHPNFPPAIFLSTYPLNRSINKIIDFFFIRSPDVFVDFALSSPTSLRPMIKAIIETQDDDAGNLFHRIVVAKDELLRIMIPFIEPVFRQMPVTTVIDFMIRSPDQLRLLIPDSDIEFWLLQHNKFSLFDIQQVMTFFKFLWDKPIAAQFLIRTEANQKTEQLNWLRRMPPQTFTLSPEDARQAADAFLNPPAPLKSVTENYGRNEIVKNSYQTFIFIRLFVLSLAQPSCVPENAIAMVIKLLFDPDEWISAGAAQLIFIWIAKYGFQVAPGIVYRVAAAAFDTTKSEGSVCLFRALLKALDKQYNVVVSILSTEPELAFVESHAKTIALSKWCFPHFKQHLKFLESLDLINFTDSLRTLGYVVNYLGLSDKNEINEPNVEPLPEQ
ncbi:hypothetical protein TRFO_33055 [Tritrichomonas foetus]|uniref:Uncharacterized protein n=1 Tax=Tritrichomonas foetus TaxID=1144522 RepID=A0A1J4JMD4_9EUKA|nr:hypothetical protein TRFO_33055 [Tritrichomonas foetus]|eukprot:OHT00273.1 hypothetical protein TRFO_33055 [Tritrichomonas foetus]